MSLRTRPSTSKSQLDSQSHAYLDQFKTYSFSYQTERDDFTTEESFDDDDYIKSSYQEKELALKKVNEELERKSNEIFKKIEKYRSVNDTDSLEETGQGDASYSFIVGGANQNFLNHVSIERSRSFHEGKPPSPIRLNGSYFSLSRSPSSEGYDDVSSRTSGYSNNVRPATAAVAPLHYSVAQTESSSRRAETAKPIIEGVEEKHQLRLQKATESVLKCVQSKLVNYEHRLTDMHLQYRQKIQENTMLESKVKALDEDRKRLLKSVQALQSTTDKFSKSVENTKMNLNLKVQAFSSLKKEMDSLKRDLKQKNGMIQSLQTRLDRCTEENRRLKSQHQSSQINLKQLHSEDRTAMDDLRQRATQLEQQKQTLQTTVEKQAQLIKNLRNQKVSLSNLVKSKFKTESSFSDFVDDTTSDEKSDHFEEK